MPPLAPPQLVPAERPVFDNMIALYPDDAGASDDTESWEHFAIPGFGSDTATVIVRNVTRPALIPFLPDPSAATGAAAIVVPGGAYKFVAVEHEGVSVARRLVDKGIAAFVLKYRLNETSAEPSAALQQMLGVLDAPAGQRDGGIDEPRAVADVAHALQLLRDRAADWQLDPKRIGLLGFSAGAIAVKRAVLDPDIAARPAFVGYVYGPMPAEQVPGNAPPLFAGVALDDGIFGHAGFGMVESWQRAGVPVELHAYERGGHGFGVGTPGTTSTGVLTQFVDWLAARGLLATRVGSL